MCNGIKIDHLATQRVDLEGVTYNFRNIEQIDSYIKGLSTSNNGYKPIFAYWYAANDNTCESFINSIKQLADVYSKHSGILFRGVLIDLLKGEISDVNRENTIMLACKYAEYYLYQGFITGVVVYEFEDKYRFYYFINPVSFWDGGKYRPNYKECLKKEYTVFNSVMNHVLNGEPLYEYEYLVAYPLI